MFIILTVVLKMVFFYPEFITTGKENLITFFLSNV